MCLYDYVPGVQYVCVFMIMSQVSCITEDNVTNYVLTDVVLPLPGHSIELPSNEGNYDDACGCVQLSDKWK